MKLCLKICVRVRVCVREAEIYTYIYVINNKNDPKKKHFSGNLVIVSQLQAWERERGGRETEIEKQL